MNIKRFEKKTRGDKWKLSKIENYTHLNKNYCKKNQIVLIGDSITDFYNYYELFDNYSQKSGLKVYNRGISGDTTNRLLERLYENALIIEPSKMVFLIGTNDLAFGADNEYICNNIKYMVQKTKKVCPECEIAVQSIYPVIDHRQRHNKDIKEINVLIRNMCEKENVTYIDLYDALCDEKGQFKQKYTYDGLHPNVFGYEVSTKAITEFLER